MPPALRDINGQGPGLGYGILYKVWPSAFAGMPQTGRMSSGGLPVSGAAGTRCQGSRKSAAQDCIVAHQAVGLDKFSQ
jgi:hypothetical protein